MSHDNSRDAPLQSATILCIGGPCAGRRISAYLAQGRRVIALPDPPLLAYAADEASLAATDYTIHAWGCGGNQPVVLVALALGLSEGEAFSILLRHYEETMRKGIDCAP